MSEPDPAQPPQRALPLDDEAAIVARAVAGDRAAFAQLAEHYQGACYGLALRLTGDPDAAMDATQDALIHAYDGMARYRGGQFRSWILRIAANASYDILRRAQRRPASALPETEEGGMQIADLETPGPIEAAERSELYRHLERALQRLPEDQRVAVVLCDVYGMDYLEVARLTEAPVGTVKSRIHRGRLHLRQILGPHRELFER